MPSIFRTAHGDAANGGASLVAETPPIDELQPLDPADAAKALARVRGRPFQRGNRAAEGRGPSLTRVFVDPEAPEERRKVQRKARSLKRERERELEVQHGGFPVSTAVQVELVAWARNTAWAEFYDRQGDAKQAAMLTEKASGHNLKAIAIAEREAGVWREVRNRTPRVVQAPAPYRVTTTPEVEPAPVRALPPHGTHEEIEALIEATGAKRR